MKNKREHKKGVGKPRAASGVRYEGVTAKKGLGQHFLANQDIAIEIVDSLLIPESGLDGSPTIDGGVNVVEIGPGTGVLTNYLLMDKRLNLQLCEIDEESIGKIKEKFPQYLYTLQQRDFLQTPLDELFPSLPHDSIKRGTNGNQVYIIGNFPYNISSQIFFKILDERERVAQVVCMLQREVAQRLSAGAGGKDYGILSVLLQCWYDIEYLFTVNENEFVPPPKVKSGVIRLWRNTREELGCSWALFREVVKTTFGQRRKTIRNSIKPLLASQGLSEEKTASVLSCKYMDLRPEQLGVEEFIELTKIIQE